MEISNVQMLVLSVSKLKASLYSIQETEKL